MLGCGSRLPGLGSRPLVVLSVCPVGYFAFCLLWMRCTDTLFSVFCFGGSEVSGRAEVSVLEFLEPS